MGIDSPRLPIFAGLRAEHQKLLEPLIETIQCDAGEFVIRQDSPADFLYIILRGKIQISFKPYDGAPITVSHVGPGGLFGWSAVIGSEKYTSSAIAIEPLEAVRIRGGELRKIAENDREAGLEILNSLANAVSVRWKEARQQVKLILEKGMK
ncbi:MAG: cyclic nucleotide-binding domain-containing protein [Anaerolineales bacterium]|nr:cyclic nucleotide-binding domain-containing protein [Anaerolineales bacterium]